MMVREATAADWPDIERFFLETPLESGTSFVLDRRPSFGALPALRGSFRTFLAMQDDQLVGSVTALVYRARDDSRQVVVGEITDFRVARAARGSRAAFLLLRATQRAFEAEPVDWITCLIGEQNRQTVPLVVRRAGLPWLKPLDSFASVHFVAWRAPAFVRPGELTVRRADASDAGTIKECAAAAFSHERFAPAEPIAWPDPSGQHRAWIAIGRDAQICGVLVVWDGAKVRRLRVLRYRPADALIRWATCLGSWLGFVAPLPAPGGILGMWASRVVSIREGGSRTLRALLNAALRDAAEAGQCVVQLNLHRTDPLLRELPRYPRSTYWTTLYGSPAVGEQADSSSSSHRYHADLARV